MHPHRTAGNRRPAAPSRRRGEEVQRRLLLELVTHPPTAGDRVDDLARALKQPRARVEAAVDALVLCGLAERHAVTVRASQAALRFEALWPSV